MPKFTLYQILANIVLVLNFAYKQLKVKLSYNLRKWSSCGMLIAKKLKAASPYITSGPSCSKLTTSLVNDSLKFTSLDTQIF